jgi:hypothetical protein
VSEEAEQAEADREIIIIEAGIALHRSLVKRGFDPLMTAEIIAVAAACAAMLGSTASIEDCADRIREMIVEFAPCLDLKKPC